MEVDPNGELCDISPIPEIFKRRGRLLKPKDWTTRSDINDMVDPESNRARILTEVPSGPLT